MHAFLSDYNWNCLPHILGELGFQGFQLSNVLKSLFFYSSQLWLALRMNMMGFLFFVCQHKVGFSNDLSK